MSQDAPVNQFILKRSASDRRKATHAKPPYMTEEGLVLIDRRDKVDRRDRGALGSVHSDKFDVSGKSAGGD
jgi:hypothetical protein